MKLGKNPNPLNMIKHTIYRGIVIFHFGINILKFNFNQYYSATVNILIKCNVIHTNLSLDVIKLLND